MKLRTPLIIMGIAIVLQSTIVPYLAIKWFRPDLPLLVLIYIAARRGPFEGILIGFLAGILVDSFSVGFFGLSSFCYSVSGFVTGRLFYSDVPLPLGRWMLACGAGVLIYAVLFSYFYSLNTAPSFLSMLFTHVFPVTLYTWALGAIWAISPLYEKRGQVKI